jgi:hypothetical protein
MKRLIASSLLPAALLGSALLPAPALAQSCPNEQIFALMDANTSFLASKDNNENGKVCRSREFAMPPPGYATPFIVIDDLP